MKRIELISRVRSLTRDLSNSIFRESDIVDYLNEGIDRCKQVIHELSGMNQLLSNDEEPVLLPTHYHSLLAVFSASRCFAQDERHYQASTLMNEFEQKLDELKMYIGCGEVVITAADGTVAPTFVSTEAVKNDYFFPLFDSDVDDGVGGL